MKTTTTTSPLRIDTLRDHYQGDPEPVFQLLEYGDFECPACGEAHPIIEEIQRELGDQLGFAFRHFPLPQHPHAVRAAEAAEAAGAQGQFWPMHDALFENQDLLSDEALAELADERGLDVTRFRHDLEDGRHRERINEDLELGERAGADGTPMFYVNGERYDGDITVEALLATLTRRR